MSNQPLRHPKRWLNTVLFSQYISLFSYLSCYIIQLLQDISVYALRRDFPGRCSAQTFSPDMHVHTLCPPYCPPQSYVLTETFVKQNSEPVHETRKNTPKQFIQQLFFRHDTMKH